jgi:transcription elongation factor GreB
MGRWRPPPPKSSPYITPAGFAALQAELKGLWPRRDEVVKALSAAAAEGDRSENAEYIYRKKELAGLDRRIRYLQKRLPNLKVVADRPAADRVFFGAWVTVEDEDGELVEYRIVGPDEAAPGEQAISMDSPLARALMKKTVDDEVTISIEGRGREFVVTGIRYE